MNVYNQSDDGKILTISITGKVDYKTYSGFTKGYNDNPKLPSMVVVDISGVEYTSKPALGLLLLMFIMREGGQLGPTSSSLNLCNGKAGTIFATSAAECGKDPRSIGMASCWAAAETSGEAMPTMSLKPIW
ncbi:MAG: hypothetical protein HQK56_02585 [Deltaproteobacteria bacterium]|nr:hypothetical protein [Deltaproteobacteria bacterium]